MNGFITFLIVAGSIVFGFLIIFLIIRHCLNRATKKYLGKGIGETVKMLSDGVANECTLPYPVPKMTPLYKPKIERDYPEMGFDRMESMAKNGIVHILNAIENGKAEGIAHSSIRLQDQVRGIVDNHALKEESVHYANIKIHAAGVDNYIANPESASVIFQVSLQSNYYCEKNNKIIAGAKDKPTQNLFSVTLAHNQDLSATDISSFIEANCPNCGAPIPNGTRNCPYCGTRVVAVVDKLWQIDSFKLLK
ncbi:MAG: zinc ribbon domain-containing protein [Firmicutes bacterium]|nr:zinc ribbon domain-containing protein [[Eubacterium] siraeum]MCM1487183.1 zinc ribbon domain-containing protein [Bacillota bacterium]